MSICQTCAFNIRGPTNYICGEGLDNSNDLSYCNSYLKGNNRDIKPISNLKDVILNPFTYWDKVPRYVRGILSHKYLIMTDIGFAVFSNHSWLIPNSNPKDKGWLICPRLVKYLKKYKERCPPIDIYIYINNKSNYGSYYNESSHYYSYENSTKKDLSIYVIVSNTSLNNEYEHPRKWKYNGDLKPLDYRYLSVVSYCRKYIHIPFLMAETFTYKGQVHLLENIKY